MTLVGTSLPFQNVPMPAVDLRRFLLGVTFSSGVRQVNDLAVSQRAAGANMSVDIAAGLAMVLGTNVGDQGPYFAYNDAVYNLTGFTGAHATLPRVDRVCIRVRDAAVGNAANDVQFVILTGTATAGATLANCTGAQALPTTAGSYFLLANVLVPAASTSITNANIDTTGAQNNSPPVRAPHGPGWTNFTSTVNQGGNVALAAENSRFCRYGNLVVIDSSIDFNAAGTAGNGIIVTCSGPPAPFQYPSGTFIYYDSGTAYYVGAILAGVSPGPVWQFMCHGQTGALGTTPSFAISDADTLRYTITYQAA